MASISSLRRGGNKRQTNPDIENQLDQNSIYSNSADDQLVPPERHYRFEESGTNNEEQKLDDMDDKSTYPYNPRQRQSSYNQNNNKDEDEAEDDVRLVHTITTNSEDPSIVYIDDKKFHRDDLMKAFGGALVPGYQARSIYDFANPAPLGLCAFALTTFVSGLIDCRARSVTTNNILVGLALFYGGFIQLLAGMWSLACNNAFGGTALSSFGGCWMAFGIIKIPWFGIMSAYDTEEEFNNALGFFYLGWTLFSFIITSLTFKSTVEFCALFCFVCLTYLLTTIAKFTMSIAVTKASGVVGIITAMIAFYNAWTGLATEENSFFVPKVYHLDVTARRHTKKRK